MYGDRCHGVLTRSYTPKNGRRIITVHQFHLMINMPSVDLLPLTLSPTFFSDRLTLYVALTCSILSACVYILEASYIKQQAVLSFLNCHRDHTPGIACSSNDNNNNNNNIMCLFCSFIVVSSIIQTHTSSDHYLYAGQCIKS